MFSKLNVRQILKLSEVVVFSELSVMRVLHYTVVGNGQQQEMPREVLRYQTLFFMLVAKNSSFSEVVHLQKNIYLVCQIIIPLHGCKILLLLWLEHLLHLLFLRLWMSSRLVFRIRILRTRKRDFRFSRVWLEMKDSVPFSR